MKKILKTFLVFSLMSTICAPTTYAKKDSETYIGFIGDKKEAYVTINDEKVITIKSNKNNSLSKTKEIAENLNKLLFKNKLRGDRIEPALRDGKYIAKIDENILFSIDNNLAKENNLEKNKLTLKWVNNIRIALGAKPINNLSYKPHRSLAVTAPITNKTQFGYASWYGPYFHGRKTANGDVFDMNKLTAAHRTLPLGTMVLVTNLDTGRSVTVKINDRGPFADTHKRVIDLSKAAFTSIASINSGVARIRIDVVK